MNNHNDHNHTHHHDDTQADLTFEQRMFRMLDHWIKHNESHAATYRDWAEKARQNKLLEVEKLLNDVAEITLKVNSQFKDAKKLIGKR
jgi:hypothetical protein